MQRTYQVRWGLAAIPLAGLFIIALASLSMVCSSYASQVSVGLGIEGNSDDVAYLDQYGTWVDVEPFGSVWQPSVSPDWRPFTYGHWVWTDAGWAWVSYEPYGWLVYHYGNWDYDPNIGWFWIESSEWSPAPVQWLDYDGYCAWAPLPPAGVEWENPWHEGGLRFWVVVRDRDLDRGNIGHYRINRPPNPRDLDRRDVFHRPLGINDFERITGRHVQPETLKHGPVPMYMHPKHPMEHHEGQPGEVRHEQKPPEQTPHHNNQPEARPGENRPPENRPQGGHPETGRPPEGHAGEQHPAGGHAGESHPAGGGHAGESHGRDSSPAESQHAEAQPQESHPAEISPSENRPEETQPVQLHRMILPKSDEARVKKYGPQVERKVLVPKNKPAAQQPKQEKAKNQK